MATPVRRIIDASPLILLAKVGKLDLLRAGVSEIIVPDAVESEFKVRGNSDPVFEQVRSTDWLRIVSGHITAPEVKVWDLGAGESSVLTIALSDPDSEAILDDRDARRCAQVPRHWGSRNARARDPGETDRFAVLHSRSG